MIELKKISKYFGGVRALDDVSLEIRSGSIHGIIGENGAGKSTLMKILTGFYTRSSGEIIHNGDAVELRTPRDARELGFGMLYQEPLDFQQLSVLDNFMMGSDGFDPQEARHILRELCKTFGFSLPPSSKLEELTVGERQQLELLRLIRDKANLLILDEPTSGISQKQQEVLFQALRTLRKDGLAILLVSHKLDEIEQLCDEVTVLRHGRLAGQQQHPFDREKLLQAMFDSLPGKFNSRTERKKGRTVLDFKDVTSTAGRSGLQSITLSIQAGEVVGLAGVDGSGQSAFLKASFGLLSPEIGIINRFGEKATLPDRKDYGLATFLPADRLVEGLFPGMSIREHHVLAGIKERIITGESGLANTVKAIETYNIKGRPDTVVENLSGGNLQRLLLSLIPENVRLVLMENPTRGLDVQSAEWTWQYLHSHLPSDTTIIFASPELEEIMEQATRVLVFYNGSIILDSPVDQTGYNEISRAITGQKPLRLKPNFS
ncbi:ABC transporter ATP-binding protein [Desulfomarina sp.]